MNSVTQYMKSERLKAHRKRVEQGKKAARIQAKKKKKKPVKKRFSKSQFKAQYKTQEWIELRDRIVLRDNNRCVSCKKESKIFHVHHLVYEIGKKIWDIPDYYLVTLCPDCHMKEHSRDFVAPTKHYS